MKEPTRHLDNRGLEPPEPMMRTLEIVNQMGTDEVLEIHNDRRPMFLYPILDEQGFKYETEDQEDGSAIIRIWKE